ncbi:uncharacterized protein PSFLO_05233 [Pseudozyma flocculosa]|uniref:Uncharacterized protein n=2 Tax=Pseudozyma flocculosa TaxID=84751 RepID=A0A5C3F5U0_9BASI|nr:uncharacterized protein PSFLO_05233 [Pseudozyma flocculosa]
MDDDAGCQHPQQVRAMDAPSSTVVPTSHHDAVGTSEPASTSSRPTECDDNHNNDDDDVDSDTDTDGHPIPVPTAATTSDPPSSMTQTLSVSSFKSAWAKGGSSLPLFGLPSSGSAGSIARMRTQEEEKHDTPRSDLDEIDQTPRKVRPDRREEAEQQLLHGRDEDREDGKEEVVVVAAKAEDGQLSSLQAETASQMQAQGPHSDEEQEDVPKEQPAEQPVEQQQLEQPTEQTDGTPIEQSSLNEHASTRQPEERAEEEEHQQPVLDDLRPVSTGTQEQAAVSAPTPPLAVDHVAGTTNIETPTSPAGAEPCQADGPVPLHEEADVPAAVQTALKASMPEHGPTSATPEIAAEAPAPASPVLAATALKADAELAKVVFGSSPPPSAASSLDAAVPTARAHEKPMSPERKAIAAKFDAISMPPPMQLSPRRRGRGSSGTTVGSSPSKRTTSAEQRAALRATLGLGPLSSPTMPPEHLRATGSGLAETMGAQRNKLGISPPKAASTSTARRPLAARPSRATRNGGSSPSKLEDMSLLLDSSATDLMGESLGDSSFLAAAGNVTLDDSFDLNAHATRANRPRGAPSQPSRSRPPRISVVPEAPSSEERGAAIAPAAAPPSPRQAERGFGRNVLGLGLAPKPTAGPTSSSNSTIKNPFAAPSSDESTAELDLTGRSTSLSLLMDESGEKSLLFGGNLSASFVNARDGVSEREAEERGAAAPSAGRPLNRVTAETLAANDRQNQRTASNASSSSSATTAVGRSRRASLASSVTSTTSVRTVRESPAAPARSTGLRQPGSGLVRSTSTSSARSRIGGEAGGSDANTKTPIAAARTLARPSAAAATSAAATSAAAATSSLARRRTTSTTSTQDRPAASSATTSTTASATATPMASRRKSLASRPPVSGSASRRESLISLSATTAVTPSSSASTIAVPRRRPVSPPAGAELEMKTPTGPVRTISSHRTAAGGGDVASGRTTSAVGGATTTTAGSARRSFLPAAAGATTTSTARTSGLRTPRKSTTTTTAGGAATGIQPMPPLPAPSSSSSTSVATSRLARTTPRKSIATRPPSLARPNAAAATSSAGVVGGRAGLQRSESVGTALSYAGARERTSTVGGSTVTATRIGRPSAATALTTTTAGAGARSTVFKESTNVVAPSEAGRIRRSAMHAASSAGTAAVRAGAKAATDAAASGERGSGISVPTRRA